MHVWINHDHDLVDLTITTTTHGQHGKPATKTSEVIHTNQKHPFFTMEHGFLPVGQIKLGMHLLRADGRVGVVTGWKVVPGTQVMYNLEVAQDHTFTVGAGQWVVHNCAQGPTLDQRRVEYVRNNIDTLIPGLGPEIPEYEGVIMGREGLNARGGYTDVDLLYENGLLEVGGPGHGANADALRRFEAKLSLQQRLTQENGIGHYYLYDASDGPIFPELQTLVDQYGTPSRVLCKAEAFQSGVVERILQA